MSPVRHAVTADGVVLRRGSRTAVAASDFTVPDAQVTAIIGANGSGKSTLLHALAGVIDLHAGRLSVRSAAPADSRGSTSYVLQSNDIPLDLPLTVRDAVMMGRFPSLGWWRRPSAEDKSRVEEALETLKIGDLSRRQLGELSGGQRQRVMIAQGLAQDHDLLLLDEPHAGVDAPSAEVIASVISDERDQGRCVIVATHDLDVARDADHVLLMRGRVLAHGTPDEVLTRRQLDIAFGLAPDEQSSWAIDH